MVQPRAMKVKRGKVRDLLTMVDNYRDTTHEDLEAAREERLEEIANLRYLEDRLRRAYQRHRMTEGRARARIAQQIQGITQRLRQARARERARRQEFDRRYPRR